MSSPTAKNAPAEPPLSADLALRSTFLKAILILGFLDLCLFLPLIYAVIAGDRGVSKAFGPAHGTGFIIEMGLIGWGSYKGWWGWWYTIVSFITTGPPGALLGHGKAKREALGGE
jgi:hypothetical protein